ncbi:hypothetical protein ACLKA7_009853 [Drosophila subpalustris]
MGIFLLLLLLELSVQVFGECRMNTQYVMKSNSTFTTRDEHGKLQLLRFNFVDDGAILELHCPGDNGAISIRNVKCLRGRLVPNNPLTCKETIKAKVRLTDKDQSCPATMYSIGIEIENEFHELYRACYDKENVRSHFSEATVYWKPIHPKFEQRPTFTTDELITPSQSASFQTKNIYYTFVNIFGRNQNYIKKNKDNVIELLINRGHLTASSDMLFNDQMNSTFKLLNVVPQFKSINDGNWLQIEHWIGNNITEKSMVQVRTGAAGVLKLLDFKPKRTLQPAYLIPDNKQNPVPEWMYKVVRDSNNRPLYAFITYNNIFNPTKPPAPKCCKIVNCPEKLSLKESAKDGFTYCCDPVQFVDRICN